MSENTRSVVFATLLSLVCCVLITAACTGLQKYQKANIELDRQTNVIKAAGLVDSSKKYTADDIRHIYTDRIVRAWINIKGELFFPAPPAESEGVYELYLCRDGDKLTATVIPLVSRGLWGRISGYIAIAEDGETVLGFSVADHAETPGLGGEIESEWFTRQFRGKKIVDFEKKFVSVTIAKGEAKGRVSDDRLQNYVDGISGATITGDYLSHGILETLQKFEPFSLRLRDGMAEEIKL